jgi:hypothetical protein
MRNLRVEDAAEGGEVAGVRLVDAQPPAGDLLLRRHHHARSGDAFRVGGRERNEDAPPPLAPLPAKADACARTEANAHAHA